LKKTDRFPLPAFLAVMTAAMISGAAGLAYEVAWSRMLVIPLGNSADATALVLAAFMLGIAVGGLLLGSLADQVRYRLKLYAALEIGLGVYALAMPFLTRLLSTSKLFSSGSHGAILNLAAAGLLVFLPSLAMGATLPVLVRALSSNVNDVKKCVGMVYGINTVGAAIGASLAGFVTIPDLGLTMTSAVFACLSFCSGIIALVVNYLLKNAIQNQKEEFDPDVERESHRKLPRSTAVAALIGAAGSGFIMLSAEVLWARVLTFVFGHDTYAFAVLLAVVLLGLGAGGLIHRKLADRNQTVVLGVLTGFAAMALLDSFWIAASLIVEFGHDPLGIEDLGNLANSLRLEFIREILYAPILVFVPSVLAGAAFPAACALYTGPMTQSGHRVGTAALANGLGAAAGALLTSFVLVSKLGIQGSFIALALTGAVVSLAIMLLGKSLIKFNQNALLVAPAVLTFIIAAVIPASLPRAMLEEAVGKKHQRILYYEEARTGTVSVTENKINGEKQLFMNAVNEVTTRLVHDQSFKLLGHLGPLLHPKPEKGLMICFGAGLSAGAALVHPFGSLDVVEISEAMQRAARLWAKENNSVLEDPRFHLHIADGRHFLAQTKELFDVVMVDSTHPKAVDSWILYTREFYELVRSRLDDGGIAVQWVPLHGLSESEFKIIARTFQSVFPETTLWVNVGFEVYGQAAYVKMVGTKEPLHIDYRELALRLKEPRINADLEPFGMSSPEEVLDSFLAGPKSAAAWTEGLPVQTDDRPIIPYTTSFSSGRRMAAPLLLAVRSGVFPLLRRMGEDEAEIRKNISRAIEAVGFLLADMLERAFETWPDGRKIRLYKEQSKKGRQYYLSLAEKYPNDPKKLFEIASYLGNLGHAQEARRLYEKAIRMNPGDKKARLNLALVMLDLGEVDASSDMLSQILKEDPDNALAHYNLGVALTYLKDSSSAISHLERAVSLEPDLAGARLSLAQAMLNTGRTKQAEAQLEALISKNRWIAEAWDLLGLAAAKRGDWARAKKFHIRALELEPYKASAHYNLGIALQEEGRLKEAAAAYQAALKIEPNDAEALNNLGLVFAAAGMYEDAVKEHQKALNVDPGYAEAAYNLGLALGALGRPQAAADAFGLALKISPTLTSAKDRLGELGLERVEIEVEHSDAGQPDSK
jgi:spermidine synthase